MSFNGRFRDELMACVQFNALLELQVLAGGAHRVQHLHGSLDALTLDALHQHWIKSQEQLSTRWTKFSGPSHEE